MTIKYLFALCILTFGLTQPAIARNPDNAIQQVEARVEQLRNAMINADAEKLKELTATELNYGHSGGHVESQAAFVEKIVSGKSDFVTIELRDQTIQIVKDIAIVRHTLVGTINSNDNGKSSDVDIGVMLIWQKQHGIWKLLARQAFKTH
jgi:ketosteroid isomerase-like protein